MRIIFSSTLIKNCAFEYGPTYFPEMKWDRKESDAIDTVTNY